MKIDLHDLKSQHHEYKDEINAALQPVFDSCHFIMGPQVHEFEQALGRYLGCQNVITCASGTDALLLALMGIDIKPGDEIITTPFTFIATAEVICLLGGKPVFVDIQEDSYNIDPAKIAEKITNKTRAIMPVSLYGQPADMDEINAIADHFSQQFDKKIYVIEDAAQSLGAEYKGRKSANLSDIGCISFFPTKPLGCYGDGGALTVHDDLLAEKIKSLRVHGQVKRYYHKHIGINGRLDTLQAAILQVKLKYFDKELQQRKMIADYYDKLLNDLDVQLPVIKVDRTSAYAQYSIRLQQREYVSEFLKARDIPTAVHYPRPLHLQECFSYLDHSVGDFPISEKIATEIMSLPMSAFLTEIQQKYIANALQEVFGQALLDERVS